MTISIGASSTANKWKDINWPEIKRELYINCKRILQKLGREAIWQDESPTKDTDSFDITQNYLQFKG